jgi:predicted lipoprotein with Yx(FWY)xxD motif
MPARAMTRQRHMLGDRRRVVAVGGGLAAVLLAACSSSSGATASTPPVSAPSTTTGSTALVHTGSTPAGTVLVDAGGRTIYVFAADSPGHSTCSGSCLTYWPPVPAPATIPSSIPGVTATLGMLKRSDGTRQLTVNGWPVYTYSGDTGPGSSAGQGVNGSGGLWWVLGPSGAQMTDSGSGSSTSPSPSTSATGSGSGGGWA